MVHRDSLTRRVRGRVHFWARPTTEKGSQWVGMKEWSSETVAIPPIVERSFALKLSISSPKPLKIYSSPRGNAFVSQDPSKNSPPEPPRYDRSPRIGERKRIAEDRKASAGGHRLRVGNNRKGRSGDPLQVIRRNRILQAL